MSSCSLGLHLFDGHKTVPSTVPSIRSKREADRPGRGGGGVPYWTSGPEPDGRSGLGKIADARPRPHLAQPGQPGRHGTGPASMGLGFLSGPARAAPGRHGMPANGGQPCGLVRRSGCRGSGSLSKRSHPMASHPDAIIRTLMRGNIGLLGRCWRQSPHKSPHSARACLGGIRQCRNYATP